MSTYVALHVQSDDTKAIEGLLERWLRQLHKFKRVRITVDTPLDSFYGLGFNPNSKKPSALAIVIEPPGWHTILSNSVSTFQDISRDISKSLSCRVVVVLAESVTESYYIAVHDKGTTMRVLEFSGESGNWKINSGNAFPFESNPLGTNIGRDQNPFYVFERNEVQEYCSHLGLKLWNDNATAPNCTVLQPVLF